jgi:hypothetical protein
MEVGKMPAQRKTKQSRGLTAAGLIAVSAATLLMMALAVLTAAPAIANDGCPHTGDQPGLVRVTDIADGDLPTTFNGTTFSVSGNTVTVGGNPATICIKWGQFTSGLLTNFTGNYVMNPSPPALSHISVYSTTTTTSTTTTATSTTTTATSTTTTASTTTTTPGGGGGGGTTTTPPATTTTTTSAIVAPTTVHNTSTAPTAEVLPTTVRPGKLAFTGIEDVVPIGALALTLMTTGSGLLWAGSRRRRHDGSEDED